ncbi:MAG: putative glycoside hydrolase [Actinomycetota bacterium]|nr:putative glycoside hydrolase [Actinomycetota bacterium]
MATEFRRIPGVADPRRRRSGPARHRDAWGFGTAAPARSPFPTRRRRFAGARRERRTSWTTVALTLGYVAAGLYGVNALRTFVRVDVAVAGIKPHAVLTSAAAAQATVSFTIDPGNVVDRTVLTLDGKPVARADRQVQGSTISFRPGTLVEGRHDIVVSVPRPGMGPSRVHRQFVIDDTPPTIDVPALLPAASISQPMTITGKVESSATLTLDGAPLSHKNGTFSLHYDRPPAAPLHLVATDTAGNETTAEVIAPVLYPGGQGIHVTAAAWGYEPLRKGVLDLIDSKVVSSVELDLKDEGGIVGYDSKVPLANQIGAVRPEYNLKDTVADLKRRGVRVIGRIVAFRDAPLAQWAWANGRHDWVVQTAAGGMLDTYGGFTNPANAEVHTYNLDIALEAAGAGVDDILWDYVRRPEGDPATMLIPGLPGSTSNAIVDFLAGTHAALRARGVFQGAAVFGIAADNPEVVGQDIPRMARNVDYLAPMLYPSHWTNGEYNVKNPNKQPADIIKASLADFQGKIDGTGKALMPWLQDFSLGVPYGPTEVRAQIDAAASLGVGDWLLWNAEVTYTKGALSPSLVKLH